MSSASELLLSFHNVNFSYEKESPFIQDLSCSIVNGEFIGLLGANGSGKSTILKLAGGLLKASAGDISLWGKPLLRYPPRDRAKLLSYLPQVLDMHIPFTVRELVRMGLYPYNILPEMRVEDALKMVGLEEKEGTPITRLSGGERRRGYIAMTLLQGSGLLLLDEPLANLDIRFQIELIRLLKELRDRQGITVVMALHELNAALQFDRIILIKEGGVIASGAPERALTEGTIRKAFDVDVEIRREESGRAYIAY